MIITHKMAEDAAITLGLCSSVGILPEDVTGRYRALAKKLHPDRGGDPTAFIEIDRAKCILLEWFERPQLAPVEPGIASEKCPMCHGAGKRTLRRGFRTMTMVCGTCRGMGEMVNPDKVEE